MLWTNTDRHLCLGVWNSGGLKMEESVLHASRFGDGSLRVRVFLTLIHSERVAKSCMPIPGQYRARLQDQNHEGSSLQLLLHGAS
jgi:hypothetical protein